MDRNGKPRWSDLWLGLSWIVQPGEVADAVELRNGPGCRPYIAYPFTRESGCRYSGWRARDNIGSIAFTSEERYFAIDTAVEIGPFILLEPHVPEKSNPNKQWGWERWQALANLLAGHVLVQVGPPGTQVLDGVRLIETSSFRYGAAVLSRAALSVLPEGGLHHAAGALGRPAVVLFGGAVDVNATGYPRHVNIVDDGPGSPCGAWTLCQHCADVWRRLRPEDVAARVEAALGDQ